MRNFFIFISYNLVKVFSTSLIVTSNYLEGSHPIHLSILLMRELLSMTSLLAFGVTPKVFSPCYKNIMSLNRLVMLQGDMDSLVWVDS
jgi:hypothetical protein